MKAHAGTARAYAPARTTLPRYRPVRHRCCRTPRTWQHGMLPMEKDYPNQGFLRCACSLPRRTTARYLACTCALAYRSGRDWACGTGRLFSSAKVPSSVHGQRVHVDPPACRVAGQEYSSLAGLRCALPRFAGTYWRIIRAAGRAPRNRGSTRVLDSGCGAYGTSAPEQRHVVGRCGRVLLRARSCISSRERVKHRGV